MWAEEEEESVGSAAAAASPRIAQSNWAVDQWPLCSKGGFASPNPKSPESLKMGWAQRPVAQRLLAHCALLCR
eukprot:jgi/Chlat1/1899/Chrsp147S08695